MAKALKMNVNHAQHAQQTQVVPNGLQKGDEPFAVEVAGYQACDVGDDAVVGFLTLAELVGDFGLVGVLEG